MAAMTKIFLAVFLLWLPAAAGGQVVSSTELIERARDLDGQTVIYAGEVVGEVMIRGDRAWINVSDGQNVLGCWCGKEQAAGIKYCGQYGFRGDYVQVTGTFNRACRQHGGEFDLHAGELSVTAEGGKRDTSVTANKKKLAIFLAVPAALIAVYYFVRTRFFGHGL